MRKYCDSYLPKEYRNALDIASTHFLNSKRLPISELSCTCVCDQGSIHVFEQLVKISKIPSNPHWHWNQTKGRKTDVLQGSITEFFKMIPRRKKGTKAKIYIPSMKLWQFNITLPDSDEKISLLWCERGEQEPADDDLVLDDFRFLSDFMPNNIADDIWNSDKCIKVKYG